MSATPDAYRASDGMLTETVLQFGAGRFLRGFIDRFIQQANDAGQRIGRVVIVQSTPGERASTINEHPGGYPVIVRGYQNGRVVDRVEQVACVIRAVVAAGQWDEVLKIGAAPGLRLVVTNSTEAGYKLDDHDSLDAAPPTTMPAKLTAVLWQRFRAGMEPLVILPCELIQNNATRLLGLVLEQARRWKLGAAFAAWVSTRCQWLNNLVDCMICGVAADDPATDGNPLAVQAEPYALLAIEGRNGMPAPFDHPAVQIVDDLEPYYLRKVRILNGLHTAMVTRFDGSKLTTVQAVMADCTAQRWVRDVLYEEIVPTIAHRAEGVAEFADATLDRFRNPFLAHRLADIALNHEQKVQVRLQPTYAEYLQLFGRPPRRLQEVINQSISPT